MAKPKATPPFDLDSAFPPLVAELQARGLLRKSDLKRLRVPAECQDAVLEHLQRAGFELVKAGARLPLAQQIEQALRERKLMPLPAGKWLKGGSPAEYRAAVLDLAKAGRVHLLVRGKAEAVAGSGTAVMNRDEMRVLGQLAQTVLKALKGRPLQRTLLREDVQELLMDLVSPDRPVSRALPDRLVQDAARLRRLDTGLCFVPELVLASLAEHSLAEVHEALVQGVQDGRLELRPESGMNRLTALESALCPEGWQGTRLSWARSLVTAP